MYITKVNIYNFKSFKDKFTLILNNGLNILVGNNEAGKSTVLEAIHLALSGLLHGRYLKYELTQYLFNNDITKEYIDSLSSSSPISPPAILIELFFSGAASPMLAMMQGNNNKEKIDASGISYFIEFDEQYQSEYAELVKTGSIKTIPIEYYKVTLRSFAREQISTRSIPIKSALIDSSSSRMQNGSDIYISRIIRDNLEDKERVEISQAHRQMKETFMDCLGVQAINAKITSHASVTNKQVTISVDLSTQNAWEGSLMTYLDEVPFHHIGKGEQSIVKTNLALSHQKSQEANVLLLEEPENHLSYSMLNELINKISGNIGEKQFIISTHSSFVANKLGLDNLVLLNECKNMRLSELSKDTGNFFKKLAGYNTLRLVLCKKAILVEGDSDELIVQKAYMRNNQGRLPIEDSVDVISVGTSFLRFLEIAEAIDLKVSVITDNDGNIEALEKKYANYLGENKKNNITIHFDRVVDPYNGELEDFNNNTLEPKFFKENGRVLLNEILGSSFDSDDDLLKHMRKNKVDCALKIFDSDNVDIKFPQYILDGIENEQ